MNDESRIKQFEQMTLADPDNELAHFSLGKAYVEAGRFAEAIEPLTRVLAINDKISKAYELLGEAYEGSGRRDDAIKVVTQGVRTADQLGDSAPRDAMAELLREWRAPVPEPVGDAGDGPGCRAARPPAGAAGSGFKCARCGRPDGQLPKAPFKGALGQTVFTHTCAACWREWIPMGTKVINELGLVLSTRPGQDAYDQYMVEFLQLEKT